MHRPASGVVTRSLDVILAAALFIEIALIDMQAARGTTSHFNYATRLDAAVFGVMGVSIACIWLAMLALTVVLFSASPLLGLPGDGRSGWAWAWRWLGQARCRWLPNPQQLAEAHATGRLPIGGAHTVGAPDGGRGLPVTGWSADHGDLRIAHFLGMHGLQVLPLLAWWMARRRARPDERRSVISSLRQPAAIGAVRIDSVEAFEASRLHNRIACLYKLCCVAGAYSCYHGRD